MEAAWFSRSILFNIKNNYNFHEDNNKSNITSLSDGIDPKIIIILYTIQYRFTKILDRNKKKSVVCG